MLLSVTTLTVCVERLRVLVTSRRIFLKDYCSELPQMMRREAIKGHRADPTFSEDDFVLLVLQQYGVVDKDLIGSIRNEFKRIEEFGLSVEANDGEIEVETLFEHLVARGQILDSNRVAPGTTCQERNGRRAQQQKESAWMMQGVGGGKESGLPDSVVDMSTPDKGYTEWFEEVWTPFLDNDDEYVDSVAAHESRLLKNKAGRNDAIAAAAAAGRVSRAAAFVESSASRVGQLGRRVLWGGEASAATERQSEWSTCKRPTHAASMRPAREGSKARAAREGSARRKRIVSADQQGSVGGRHTPDRPRMAPEGDALPLVAAPASLQC